MMLVEVIKQELKKQNFGFSCRDGEYESFYRTQYSKNRKIYLVYRLLIMTYIWAWFLAYYIRNAIWNPNELAIGYRYFTRWGYYVNIVYFTLSFINIIILCCQKDPIDIEGSESDRMCVFRSTIWLLHSVGQTSALLIVVLYWIFASRSASDVGTPLDIDAHGINFALYAIEIFVVAFPMRLLHVIYPVLFGLTYFMASLIMHAAGNVSAIYHALDWANSPGQAVALGIGGSLIGGVIGHVIMFGLFRLRLFLHMKCQCCPELSSQQSESVQTSYVADNVSEHRSSL